MASGLRYWKSDKGKAANAKRKKGDAWKASNAKYRKGDARKASEAKYAKSDKGKASHRKAREKYNNSDHGKEVPAHAGVGKGKVFPSTSYYALLPTTQATA